MFRDKQAGPARTHEGDMPARRKKRVNLALQGGGAHGAFTWGVLDALLEDGRLEIAAISGTSAGAMNAVAVADGFVRGGPEEARACLRRFWEGAARAATGGVDVLAAWAPLAASLAPVIDQSRELGLRWLETWSSAVSPYNFNPLNWNPLRDLINELIDFEKVRDCKAFPIFVAATNVESGRTRIFRREELTADHVMASACLPTLYQAVEIDGVPYWDGGFVGNPALYPFFYESDSRDVLIVQINPIERKGTPRSPAEILDRMREITFNSSLLRELRAIEFVARLVHEDRLDPTHYREILIHRIEGGEALAAFASVTRLTMDMALYDELFALGRAAGQAWLEAQWSHVGKRATVDLRALLEKPGL
jgi:NTE family protein